MLKILIGLAIVTGDVLTIRAAWLAAPLLAHAAGHKQAGAVAFLAGVAVVNMVFLARATRGGRKPAPRPGGYPFGPRR